MYLYTQTLGEERRKFLRLLYRCVRKAGSEKRDQNRSGAGEERERPQEDTQRRRNVGGARGGFGLEDILQIAICKEGVRVEVLEGYVVFCRDS